MPFYSKEAEKFVKKNDEIANVMEFLTSNFEEFLKIKYILVLSHLKIKLEKIPEIKV